MDKINNIQLSHETELYVRQFKQLKTSGPQRLKILANLLVNVGNKAMATPSMHTNFKFVAESLPAALDTKIRG